MKNIKQWSSFIGESQEDIRISTIDPSETDDVIEVLYQTFKTIGATRDDLRGLIPRITNGISLKASYGNEIVGVYLLKENSVNNFIESVESDQIKDFRRDETKIFLEEPLSDNGIQGIALAILPEYRNMGIPGKMIDQIRNMGYDYMWGVQDKSLENIEYWKKTRKIFAESPINWATYTKFI